MRYILIFLGSLFISDYAISANSMHDQSESKHHYTPTIKKDIQDKASSSLSEPNISLRTKSMEIQELRKSLINSKPFIAPAKYNIIKNILDTCENNGSSENLQYLNIRIPTPKANETSLQSSKLKKNKKIRDKRKAKKSSSLPNNNTSLISSINSIPLISSIEKPGALASTEEPKSILEGPTSRPKTAAKKSSSLLSDSSLKIEDRMSLASAEEINSVVEKFKKIFNNITQHTTYKIISNGNLNINNDINVFKIIAKFKDLIKVNRTYNSLLKINSEFETEFSVKNENLYKAINNIKNTFIETRTNEGWNTFKREITVESKTFNIQDFQEWNFEVGPPENAIQSLIGYLFFPAELEGEYDFPEVFYINEKIQLSIAYAARWKHPIALYHLYRILNKYSSIKHNEAQDFEESIYKFITNPPVYYSNFYSWILQYLINDNKISQNNNLPSNIKEDPRFIFLTYKYKEKFPAYKNLKKDKAQTKGYAKAQLSCIQFDSDLNMKSKFENYIKEYINVANEGITEGFYRAAIMIGKYLPNEPQNNSRCLEYLKISKELNVVGAYKDWIKYLERKQAKDPTDASYDEIIEAYKDFGNRGNPIGYFHAAQMYENDAIFSEDDTMKDKLIDKARKYYIKAGPLLGYEKAINLCRSTDDQKKLLEIKKIFWHDHINRLIIIATPEKDIPILEGITNIKKVNGESKPIIRDF